MCQKYKHGTQNTDAWLRENVTSNKIGKNEQICFSSTLGYIKSTAEA